MYILKNAIISIKRNKGRNILIGLIILIISCSATVTLAINSSSNSLIESYENKYEVEATFGLDRENMMKSFNPEDRENSTSNMKEMFNSASDITKDEIVAYADSEYVKDYYYTVSTDINLEGIEKAESSSKKGNMFGPGGFEQEATSSDFTIKGYSSINSMNEFIEGNYKITEGEVSQDFEDNSCLINSELATLNSLKVGDTIKVISPSDETVTYELVISGIFEENTESSGMSMFSQSVNTIITNVNFVNMLNENNSEFELSINPTFILNSKDVIDAFTEEVKEKGLNENLTVETNLDQVEGATSTIVNVKNFSITFLFITLIIGTSVLLIINMINIRERKYEIGVLRTIGMKKSKVCLQFVLELVIVSFVFLLVGAGIGSLMSTPVSNKLLENEMNSSQNEMNDIKSNFGKNFDMNNSDKNPGFNNIPNNNFKGVTNISAFDSINATVNLKVLFELLGIGLLITLVSSISAVTSIQKFSPLTILKERS